MPALHALVHASPAYYRAFGRWMQARGQNPLYSPDEVEAVRTALNITTGASGAYSLPSLLDETLIHVGAAKKNPIRDISRVEQISQNVWRGVSVTGVTTYWSAEASALTDGSPTLAQPIATASKLTAWLPMSWVFFEDSTSVQQLPQLVAEAMTYEESGKFVVGSGSGEPLGIVTAISTTIASTVTATTRGSFTSASSADLFAVANAVATRYEDSSTG